MTNVGADRKALADSIEEAENIRALFKADSIADIHVRVKQYSIKSDSEFSQHAYR